LLTGKIKPDRGELIPGVTTRIGYFTQETANLDPGNRVIEEVKNIAEFITLADGTQISASKFLDLFLFPPEKQYTFIDKLSGGEKKRLQLLKILVTSPNFLILDEPTNDFDIDTLNVLEDFLEKFTGCLLLVSHDRYFMDHLVDQLFVFEGEGRIKPYNGNYSDYRIREEAGDVDTDNGKVAKIIANGPSSGKRKPSFKERTEYETVEREIERLEQERDVLMKNMSQPELTHEQLIEFGSQIAGLTKEIDAKTLRWLELSEVNQDNALRTT
jgi:ABC transport system ATP-binding/permease protein